MDTALLDPSLLPIPRDPASRPGRQGPASENVDEPGAGPSKGGARPSVPALSPKERRALDQDGYVVLSSVLDEQQLTRLRHRHGKWIAAEGSFGGVVKPTRLQSFAGRRDHPLALAPLAAGLRASYRLLRFVAGRIVFPLLPGWKKSLRSVEESPGFGAPAGNSKPPGRLTHVARWTGFAELRAAFIAAAFHEPGVRRIANLPGKDAAFDVCLDHPRVLAAVQHLLGGQARLSSLDARTVLPKGGAEPLHTDSEHGPCNHGATACKTLWLLDDSLADNGSMRVVPGTHRSSRIPAQELHDPAGPVDGERRITAPAGSVVILCAHVWHGGTCNASGTPRTTVEAFFARRDQPRRLDQLRAPAPTGDRRWTDKQRRLLGLGPRAESAGATESALSAG